MQNLKLEAALKYSKMGLSIIPVGADKISLIKWEPYQSRSPSVDEITAWWKQWPEANLALITGKISGVVALDLDKKHNRTSKEFTIPPTACAKSGGGGEHFFFKYPSNASVKSGAAISGEGVDCRGDKGYILLSPSVNENGGKYEWIVPLESKEDLAEMPEWFLKLVTEDKDEKKWLSGKDGVPEGSRNDTAASMAGKIISSTVPELLESIGWEQFKVWNNKNTPPISEKELRNVWDSIANYDSDEETSSKESAASKLLKLIQTRKDIIIFRDSHGDPFIALEIEGVRQVWPCRSKQFRQWLSLLNWKTYKTALPADAKSSVISTIEGFASFEKEIIPLQTRNAYYDGELSYDLTNDKWQIIKVTAKGWGLAEKPPIMFRRYAHNRTQVMPVLGGDMRLLLKYFNISDPQQQLLVLVYIVCAFIPGFGHPILLVHGPQGSAKSTFSRLLRLTIDPSVIEVSSMPDSHRELVQIIAHNSFIFFDNVSYISEDVSDLLCKAVTGGSFPKRELYSDDDDIIYTFRRGLGINGINMVAMRPDLLERSIILKLDRIDPENRRLEKELMAEFENDLPNILGGIFDALVKALALKPNIKQEKLPRMADFALWGCAVAEALGSTQKEFLDAYNVNIALQTDIVINENLIASTLIAFMQKENLSKWAGSATELLSELTDYADFSNVNVYNKQWPKSPGALSRKLNELKINFLDAGWNISIDAGRVRKITIENQSELPPVTSSLLPEDGTDDKKPVSTEPSSPEEIPF